LFASPGLDAVNPVGQGGGFVFGQQNRSSQSFDQTSAPNPFRFSSSVSFPPFQGAANADFKPSFAPPTSSDFAFTTPPINNPFSFPTNSQQQSTGFQGSIFNIPPSTPFGASSAGTGGDTGAPKAAAEPAFSWGSSFGASQAQPKPQSNIFNTSPAPPKPAELPIFGFGKSTPEPQQPSKNLFDHNSTSLFAATPIFNHKPDQTTGSQTQLPTPPTIPDLQGQQNNINYFGQQANPSSQPHVVELSPRKDEDRMSTTPDSSPQAKDSVTSRPFEFLNWSPKGTESDSPNRPEEPRNLFSGIAQPATVSVTPDVTVHESSNLGSSSDPQEVAGTFAIKSPRDFVEFPLSSTPAGKGAEQLSPTRNGKPAATPNVTMISSDETKAAASGLFKEFTIPTPSPSMQEPAHPVPLISDASDTDQASLEVNIATRMNESSPLTALYSSFDQDRPESIFKDPIWGKIPVAPDDFTHVQREQLAIGYQLRCLDVGLQQHILKNRSFHLESELVTKFYMDLKRRILNGEALAAQRVAGRKRKASQDGNDEEIYGKRARFDSRPEPIRAETQITSGGWLSAPNRQKSLLTEPALLPQVEMSKSQADERASIDDIERTSDVARRAPDEGIVSYPTLSAGSGSLTSNLFKNILEKRDEDPTPDTQKGALQGDKEMDVLAHPRENASRIEMDTHSTISSTSTDKTAPTVKSVPPSTAFSSTPQQEASLNPFSAISSGPATPLLGAAERSSFTPPKFGSAQPVNFLAQFGKVAEADLRKEKASRRAKDFDSDEDDETEWERKDAEQQRAKKQKLDDTVKGKTVQFVPGKGFSISDQQTESEALANTPSHLDSTNVPAPLNNNESVLFKTSQGSGNGHNIFRHLSDLESAEGDENEDANAEETASDGAIGDDTEGKEATDPMTSDESHDSAKRSGIDKPSEPLAVINPFGPPSDLTAEKPTKRLPGTHDESSNIGRSIFDRISKDENGNALREVTPPTDKREDILAGATLPVSTNIIKHGNSGAGTNIFGQQASEAGAHTFGQGTTGGGVSIFGQRTSAAGPSIFGPRTANAGRNIFGQRELDTGTNIFGQKASDAGTNIFAQRTSDPAANVVEQKGLGAEDNTRQQQTSDPGANVVEERNLEAGANVIEQTNSEERPDIGEAKVTNINDCGDEKPNSEAKTIINDQKTSEANVKIVENQKPEVGANISEQRDSEARSNIFGQVSSPSEIADFVSGSKSSLFSSTPAASTSSSTPLFPLAGNPRGDNTWKVDSPIKFGSLSSGPPGLTLTSPTPSKPSLSSLFGPSPANATPETTPKQPSSIFSFNAGKAPPTEAFGSPSSGSPELKLTSPTPSKPSLSSLFGPSPANTTPETAPKQPSSIFSFNAGKAPPTEAFGSPSSGSPELTLTSPTPSKPSLSSLFGPSPANTTLDTAAKQPSSIFNFNAGRTPAAGGFGFNFGGPPTATMGSLAAPLAASNNTSRANSPGITTGDNSAAESNAEGAEEGAEKHEQLNLADKGPGEEDEDVLFAVKAKAMIFESKDKGWATRGVGKLRVLKHRDTAKTRVLLKQEPSGKIILNAALLGTMNYEHAQNKSVKLGVATDVGKLDTWLIRTGKDEDAVELARTLEANKSN
jgi:hypothetical protein